MPLNRSQNQHYNRCVPTMREQSSVLRFALWVNPYSLDKQWDVARRRDGREKERARDGVHVSDEVTIRGGYNAKMKLVYIHWTWSNEIKNHWNRRVSNICVPWTKQTMWSRLPEECWERERKRRPKTKAKSMYWNESIILGFEWNWKKTTRQRQRWQTNKLVQVAHMNIDRALS